MQIINATITRQGLQSSGSVYEFTLCIAEKEDIKKRWAEYVDELLHDDREEKPDIEGDDGLEMLQSEVETALHHRKDG